MPRRLIHPGTIFLVFLPALLAAQQRPLQVESPCSVQARTARASFGCSYYQSQPFPLSGLEGSLSQYGILRLGYSFDGNIELQFDGTLLNMLSITKRHMGFTMDATPSSSVTGDIGDFTLWTKVQVTSEYRFPFAAGFRFGVQLPNASNESGLGLDQFDFYASTLFEKHIMGIRLTVNSGIAIIESPTQLSDQHDMWIYAIGITVPIGEKTFVALETNGRDSNSGEGVPRLADFRGGIETEIAGIHWKLCGAASLLHGNTSRGIECAVQYDFRL
ncbi:MAG: hypothetical protein NTV54_13010 [Ignavibacteriales bacterium]|nr:hypothetical protein [Ignavibacteriales bacterium]